MLPPLVIVMVSKVQPEGQSLVTPLVKIGQPKESFDLSSRRFKGLFMSGGLFSWGGPIQ